MLQSQGILWQTVSQAACLGVRHPSGPCNQFFFFFFQLPLDSNEFVNVRRPLWQEDRSVVSFLGPSPGALNLEGQVPILISHRNRVAKNMAAVIRHASRGTLYPQTFALTSPTSGGRSVGIVHSWTQAMEFFLLLLEAYQLLRECVYRTIAYWWPTMLFYLLGIVSQYSRLSIIRAWFNRFAAQPRQCIFKEKILFSVSITFV
jgi:hypothetical protein